MRTIFRYDIESYSTMTFSERSTTVAEMLRHDPQHAAFLEQASFHWFESHNAQNELIRIPIILSVNEAGQSYLSREWVRACLELRNFSTLYFGAMLDLNSEAALRLTYSLSDDPAIQEQKTQELMDYYFNHVQADEITPAEIISLRMDAITYRIPIQGTTRDQSKPVKMTGEMVEETQVPETSVLEPREGEDPALTTEVEPEMEQTESSATDSPELTSQGDELEPTETSLETDPTMIEDDTRSNYHIVTIYKREGTFVPVDIVPARSWRVAHPILTDQGQLDFNATYRMEELRELLGMPDEQYRFTFSTIDGTSRDKHIRLLYPDIELILAENPEQTEDHRLEAVYLKTDRYSLGDQFRVGNTLEDLLSVYLYLDTIGGSYVDQAGNQVQLDLAEDHSVSRISMLEAAYRADTLNQQRSEDLPVEFILPEPSPSPPPEASPEESTEDGTVAATSEEPETTITVTELASTSGS